MLLRGRRLVLALAEYGEDDREEKDHHADHND